MAACKSCKADIRWMRTTRGKMMPVDSRPNPKGNIWIDDLGVANVLGPMGQAPPGRARFMPHWQSCPASASYKAPAKTEDEDGGEF